MPRIPPTAGRKPPMPAFRWIAVKPTLPAATSPASPRVATRDPRRSPPQVARARDSEQCRPEGEPDDRARRTARRFGEHRSPSHHELSNVSGTCERNRDQGQEQTSRSRRDGGHAPMVPQRRAEVDRAPLLVVTLPGHATRTTQARWAAAPPAPRLLLLPSGPDRVYGTRSRRTRPSTQSHETRLQTAHPSKGNSTPLKRIAGTGHR
jgi:hypothetical protein